jgi:hypothetical protein
MRSETWRVLASVALAVSAGLAGACADDAPAKPFFQVDLSKFVTHTLYEPELKTPGSDLSNLALGASPNEPLKKKLKGVPFRVDGIILVGPGESSSGPTGEPAPVVKKVEGIPVGQKADQLYFLHATHWGAEKGAKIGAYVLHYADGAKEEIPVRYAMEVLDWWTIPERGADVSNAEIAWTGTCEAAEKDKYTIRLFMTKWKNPRPDVEIKSLDVVTGDQPSGQGAPCPFLVGLSGQ